MPHSPAEILDFRHTPVLVTGASGGIGAAIAAAFAGVGARVALHYRSGEETARQVLESLPGEGHVLVQGDLAREDQAARVADRAFEALGGLDVLVNNAGIFEPHPVEDCDDESWARAWRRTLDTNLLGPACLTFRAVRYLRQAARGGRVVNVSSRGAFRGEPRAAAYGASKAGLNAMSQSLAQALASQGISVYAVAPGWVDTDRVAPQVHGPDADAVAAQSPWGRVARPDEVARAVLLLAAPGNEFLTGAIVDVNGASYLRT
ncbi:MAG: SDR family oxidoreductase [Acidobacteriota bacterium]